MNKQIIKQYEKLTGWTVDQIDTNKYRIKDKNNKSLRTATLEQLSNYIMHKTKSNVSTHSVDKKISIKNIDTKLVLAKLQQPKNLERKVYKNAGCSILADDYVKFEAIARKNGTTVNGFIKAFIESIIK